MPVNIHLSKKGKAELLFLCQQIYTKYGKHFTFPIVDCDEHSTPGSLIIYGTPTYISPEGLLKDE